MKVLVALIAFLFVLSFNLKSVAEQGHTASEAATCSKETAGQNCADEGHGTAGHDDHSKKGHGANYDWSHKRHDQIRAILPGKKAELEKAVQPSKVKLVAPKFLAKVSGDSIKLEWNGSDGAKFYHIQVSKDAGFNNRSMYVAEDKNVVGTSYEVKGLEAGVKYFWRVAAVNGDQDSTYIKSAFAFSQFETQ